MNEDVLNLRSLAKAYFNIANNEHNAQRAVLHRAINSLRMIRPVVLIDELPWSEMDFNGELTLKCKDPILRDTELFMRRELYKFKYLRADMIVRPYAPIPKVIHSSGVGLEVDEEIRFTDAQNNIVAHNYKDQLQCENDLEKLHTPKITYDSAETERRFQLVGEAIGDIIPVKKVGIDHMTMEPWDNIAMFRSVTPLLIDLVDKPGFSHKMVRKFYDFDVATAEQYLKLGLFENDPRLLHCTPILCDGMPSESSVGEIVELKSVWLKSAAQIFGSVSKEMHKEFDIDYIMDVASRFGMVYYGCCEPLDRKIDIVDKIPNLRKISISPWADVRVAAEAIGKRFVVSAKPSPALLAVPMLDVDWLRREITNILDACKKNGCSLDIVIKDISTCANRPQNLFKWEQTVMEIVQSF